MTPPGELVADVNCDHGCTGAEREGFLASFGGGSLDLVPLDSREGFGGFQGASAVSLVWPNASARIVFKIPGAAGSSVRESDLEAARLGHRRAA